MERTYLKRKAVDDVLGGEDSWKNVDSTEGILLTSRLLMRGELTRESEGS